MNPESRKWFESAYEFTRGCFPFGIVTGGFEEDDIKRITKNTLSDHESERITEISIAFRQKLPSEEDFKEEKESVLARLVPELKGKLYFVDSAILFGTTVGDIDIGLISHNGISDEEFLTVVYPGCDIIKKYPIVDWDALYWFRSRDGQELVTKIVESRLLANQTNKLPSEEIDYIKNTVYNARSLWGNDELSLMRSCLSKISSRRYDCIITSP